MNDQERAIQRAQDRIGLLREVSSRSKTFRTFEITGDRERKVFISTSGIIKVGVTLAHSFVLGQWLIRPRPYPNKVSAEGVQMDSYGHYQGAKCTSCMMPLNQDGQHPAESYAGSYSGLCDECMGQAAYPIIEFADGAREISYPPFLPSHRRDREVFPAYADCPECQGIGFTKSDFENVYKYRRYCDLCFHRFVLAHPKEATKYQHL